MCGENCRFFAVRRVSNRRFLFAAEADNAVPVEPAPHTDGHVGDGGRVADREGPRLDDGRDDKQEQEPTSRACAVDQWKHEGRSNVDVWMLNPFEPTHFPPKFAPGTAIFQGFNLFVPWHEEFLISAW